MPVITPTGLPVSTSRNTPTAMITLTPITETAKLQEYYHFRYRIYNESKLKVMANNEDGTDRDAYDDQAHHYGWYVDGRLVGCIRFIEPDGSAIPIPILSYMTDLEAASAIQDYIAECKAKGQCMIEASRFCLAPEFRGLRNAREFVLAMVTIMQPLGFEHGVFDCREEQAPFYRLVGFDQVGMQASYHVPHLGMNLAIFKYDFNTLITRNRELLERMGFTRSIEVLKAA